MKHPGFTLAALLDGIEGARVAGRRRRIHFECP
jgi:hypothetical protein